MRLTKNRDRLAATVPYPHLLASEKLDCLSRGGHSLKPRFNFADDLERSLFWKLIPTLDTVALSATRPPSFIVHNAVDIPRTVRFCWHSSSHDGCSSLYAQGSSASVSLCSITKVSLLKLTALSIELCGRRSCWPLPAVI